jgi:hypothetical protein
MDQHGPVERAWHRFDLRLMGRDGRSPFQRARRARACIPAGAINPLAGASGSDVTFFAARVILTGGVPSGGAVTFETL